MKRTYDTLSEAVNDLQQRGYIDDLVLQDECLVCNGKNTSLHPDEFQIDEFHRFEGASDPGDSSIVYAVSSDKLEIKGILVNAFGADATRLTQRMVAKLATHPVQAT